MTPAPHTDQPRSLRIVPELRAVHVERHRAQRRSELLYLDTKYDLGDDPLPPSVRHVSFAGALARVLTSKAETLELPEPLWLRFLPKNVLLGLAWKVGGSLRHRPRLLVTYAMENNDLDRLVAGRRRVPRPLVRLFAVGLGAAVRAGVDRIAFASDASAALYRGLPGVAEIEQRTTPELPAAAGSGHVHPARPLTVAFAGVLEARKGVDRLLDAWEAVERRVDGARLTIAGAGPLEADLRAWAAASPETRAVLGRQTRAQVAELFATARVAAAPSVPEGRWREQIGLPIKEALAAGATVVTSSDTGLAPWLVEHGHHVVASGVRRDLFVRRLAEALEAALVDPVPVAEVLASLPEVDGRLRADAWLHAPAVRPAATATHSRAASRRRGADGDAACGELLAALRESDRVVLVNPLGVALDHYTAALARTLTESGTGVTVTALTEPSHGSGSRRRWFVAYLGALARARVGILRAGGGLVIVTWPVAGYLDLVALRVVLGARVPSRLVVHDPEPLVYAVGYAAWARRLARRLARPRSVVVHSEAALGVLERQGLADLATLVPLPLECAPRVAASGASLSTASPPVPERDLPVVRVLGQYKRDRDTDLLEAIAGRVGRRMRLEIHGRGWPAVAGWRVFAGHVEEARFVRLVETSAAVLIPYRRFYQSAVAAQCVERAVPFVGPRASSLADLVASDSPLLVDEGSLSPGPRADAWVAALDRALALDPCDLEALASSRSHATTAAWSAWLDRNFTRVA